MKNTRFHKALTYSISIVWIVNGLFCKVLNFVPRHEQIVGRILSDQHSRLLTILIGLSEISIAIWILSAYKTRINAFAQMVIVATMNILEFIFVPDLLMWGKMNSICAFIFILIVYYNEFCLNKKQLK
jgi:uncharacterized membrane protein YphA (DoxX/SURF4 family)